MNLKDKIMDELTKERFNPIVDGILDLPKGYFFSITGNEERAEQHMKRFENGPSFEDLGIGNERFKRMILPPEPELGLQPFPVDVVDLTWSETLSDLTYFVVNAGMRVTYGIPIMVGGGVYEIASCARDLYRYGPICDE